MHHATLNIYFCLYSRRSFSFIQLETVCGLIDGARAKEKRLKQSRIVSLIIEFTPLESVFILNYSKEPELMFALQPFSSFCMFRYRFAIKKNSKEKNCKEILVQCKEILFKSNALNQSEAFYLMPALSYISTKEIYIFCEFSASRSIKAFLLSLGLTCRFFLA